VRGQVPPELWSSSESRPVSQVNWDLLRELRPDVQRRRRLAGGALRLLPALLLLASSLGLAQHAADWAHGGFTQPTIGLSQPQHSHQPDRAPDGRRVAGSDLEDEPDESSGLAHVRLRAAPVPYTSARFGVDGADGVLSLTVLS
jgi:hypothetical protein